MCGMRKSLIMGMLAFAATAYISTSCSRDEFSGDVLESKKQAFESVFKSEFGNIDPDQDWGFGSTTRGMTRGNTGGTYPATHEYKDADGNVIAGANMNHNEWADPDKQFGGWVVPDALTEGQKLRVQKYFQANPNLSYEDPQFRHFFVQQVYTGGTDAPTTGNKEATKAADGSEYKGSNLNQMTVGEACSHINDFNAGTCTASQVLDNGSNVNNGTYHSDQITLMVNVFDTSCFGYHDPGGSNVKGKINHNDKMALVSAAVIDAWAAQNGNPGEAVVDQWNRSFMGFDYELLPESDIVLDSYAMLSAVPNINNIPYAWDGSKVIPVKQKASTGTSGETVDLTSTFSNSWNGTMSVNADGEITFTANSSNGAIQAGYFGYNIVSQWSSFSKFVIEFKEATPVATTIDLGGTHTIPQGTTKYEIDITNNNASGATINIPANYTFVVSRIYVEAGAQQAEEALYYETDYLLGEDNKISFYSANTNMYGGIVRNVSEDEMKTTQDGKTCLNLPLFQTLKNEGYHPVSTDLKKWVKWQAACDGYYSDWIVTLTEAQRVEANQTTRVVLKEAGRVFCEDLGQVSNRDMDYNDVVFDAWIYVKQTLANGQVTNEVPDHTDIKLWAAGGTLALQVAGEEVHSKFNVTTGTMVNTYTSASDLSDNSNCVTGQAPVSFTSSVAYERIIDIPIVVRYGNNQIMELQSVKGDAPHKFLVPIGTAWAAERVEISEAYPDFDKWVGSRSYRPWDNFVVSKLYIDDENGSRETGLPDIPARQGSVIWDYMTNHNGLPLELGWGSGAIIYDDMVNAVKEGSIIRVYGYGNTNQWAVNLCLSDAQWQWQDWASLNSNASGTSTNVGVELEWTLTAAQAAELNGNGLVVRGAGAGFALTHVTIYNPS